MEANELAQLSQAFRGATYEPSDAGYDEARTIYNAMIDRSPSLIARCYDVADVIAAVELASKRPTATTTTGYGA